MHNKNYYDRGDYSLLAAIMVGASTMLGIGFTRDTTSELTKVNWFLFGLIASLLTA